MAQDHNDSNDTQSLVTVTGNPHQKNIKILDTISASPMCICCEVIPHLKHLDTFQPHIWLVVSTPLKRYESMGRIIPYMKWKKKNMFQTTNQSTRCSYVHHLCRVCFTTETHLSLKNWRPAAGTGGLRCT